MRGNVCRHHLRQSSRLQCGSPALNTPVTLSCEHVYETGSRHKQVCRSMGRLPGLVFLKCIPFRCHQGAMMTATTWLENADLVISVRNESP
jgi:hypothetical protein